tara:strand:- start:375 stop:1304 length:930 start_codon:yes stop_codon:yes gene_type:complete
MKILFYNPWPNQNKWILSIKKKFVGYQIYTLKDKFKFEDIECAIIWNLPDNIFKKLSRLKVIFSLGAGVDHILKLPSYKDTPIFRIKDTNMSKRMFNHILSQVLYYQLKLKKFENGKIKKKWLEEEETLLNQQITIGILGAGFLGNEVGKNLKKLNYNIIGYKNSKNNTKIPFEVFTKNQIDIFLKKSDIVVSILPATLATNNFIDKTFLKKMKREGLLINVGRGNSINEKHLINHLIKNKDFYVSLDVFKNEPLTKNHKFWDLPNVTITPHIAAVTDIESSVNYIFKRINNIKKVKKIKSEVNLKKGY